MAFVIPTNYVAIDNFTPIAKRITNANNDIAHSLEMTAYKAQRSWNRIMPEADEALKRRFQFMVSMGKAMAVAGTAIYTTKAVMDYEKELANLKSLTGATASEFKNYKSIIESVATSTNVGAVDIAQAFTAIGNSMPELLKSSEGLAELTRQSVLLSRASNMDMLPAAESLTAILNQFGKGAEYAASAVDILAAGSKYGSSEIKDLQSSIVAFGRVADIGNITLKESVAITELVSKYKKGADAGVELRNVFLEMGKGFAQDEAALKDLYRLGVNISLVADKTRPFNERLQEMSKIAYDNNAILHVFGKENAAMAVTLLQNASSLNDMTQKVSESGVAMAMAAENTKTLYAILNRFKAAWTNIVVAGNKANLAMSIVKNTISFLTDNLSTLLNIIVPIAAVFVAWRGYIFATTAVLKLFTIATAAYEFTVGLAAVATGALNGNLLLLPNYARGAEVGLAILNTTAMGLLATLTKIAAIFFVIYGVMKLFDMKHKQEARMNAVLANLPANIDKEKFSEQFSDILLPGFTPLVKAGRKNQYPQELFDSLAKKYYDEPMRIQDSVMNALQYAPTVSADTSYKSNNSQNVNLKAAPIEVILKDQRGNVIGSNTANLIPTLQSTF